MPLSTLVIIGAIAVAATWLTIVPAILNHLTITRLEKKMNSSTKLAALAAASIKAITDRDTQIADLKARLAAADPTAADDLTADESEITNFETALSNVGVTLPAADPTAAQ